jgi:hypothetical protein
MLVNFQWQILRTNQAISCHLQNDNLAIPTRTLHLTSRFYVRYMSETDKCTLHVDTINDDTTETVLGHVLTLASLFPRHFPQRIGVYFGVLFCGARDHWSQLGLRRKNEPFWVSNWATHLCLCVKFLQTKYINTLES